jgi:hypothetical protein
MDGLNTNTPELNMSGQPTSGEAENSSLQHDVRCEGTQERRDVVE